MPINEACKREKTRILMADDHPSVRQGMAQFLNLQDDLRLCCEAGNTEEAKEATQDILLAIRRVLSGDIYLSAAMHSRLSRRLAAPRGDLPGPIIAGLSER
ncbi:MAG: hypothetical protein ACHBNF_03240 [Chromatiales bacterium]